MLSISNISEFGPRGVRYFSKMSELSEGGGVKPNWEFNLNFPVFFLVMAPLMGFDGAGYLFLLLLGGLQV